MKVLITEAINSAMNAFFDALGNDTYKEQYRETHFNPILIEYKRVGEDIMTDLLTKRLKNISILPRNRSI